MRVLRKRAIWDQEVYVEEEFGIESVEKVKEKNYPGSTGQVLESHRHYELKTKSGERIAFEIELGEFGPKKVVKNTWLSNLADSFEKEEKMADKFESLVKRLEGKKVKVTGVSNYFLGGLENTFSESRSNVKISPQRLEVDGREVEFSRAPKIQKRYLEMFNTLEEELK